MSDKPAIPDGLACPKCNGTTWAVVKTTAARGRIVRYRRCLTCGCSIRTRETFDAIHKPRPAVTN